VTYPLTLVDVRDWETPLCPQRDDGRLPNVVAMASKRCLAPLKSELRCVFFNVRFVEDQEIIQERVVLRFDRHITEAADLDRLAHLGLQLTARDVCD
jgi:hypothetical protein